ncbi:YceH family protein [Pseudoalteromonas sp. MMG005]|uniref:YceH family protein n=1 Tax=Pseudoalteromonas sp. MMG005 TaxID=2822682 RepID=UPI001B3A1248|nr:YceH family protein [Pseudoalteromonas sp. MMG005]MBQ4847847.1 YceH family protein [Pseudoalteromonas sp. MMG005]
MKLTPNEQRIIGCLLEKQTTTPEHYPLSLNALTNACNQKSNREPVLSLTESEVLDTLTQLENQRVVLLDEGLSGRVNKYSHRFCNTEFSDLQLSDKQRAILCIMLLRGPQTPGELRTRSARLAEFNNVSDVENTLEEMQSQKLICKLEREPGKRESRYQHLLGDHKPTVHEPHVSKQLSHSELESLVDEISQLRTELAAIKQHLGL